MSDGTVSIAVNVDGKDVTGLNKDLDQLEGKSTKANRSIRDMAVAVGAVKLASAAFNVLKNSVGDAVSRFDTMQKFPKVMKALGFSAEDSDKSIKKLSDGIDGLPTKLDDVVANTQQMTAITGDLDKSTDTVLALNNAFLASGASTDDANRGMQQYNQMLSTGQVDLESWKTLQETMPLALQKTAEAMGYTGKSAQRDLYQALKDGTVTFDQFQDKLIELGTGTGDLAKLAKENSLGIATSFGNLRNAVSKNLANILTKFDELVQKLSGKTIAQHIDGLKGIINSAGASIVKSMDNIIPLIQKGTAFVKEHATAFKILGGIIVSVAAGFIAFKATVGIINSVSSAIKGVKTAFTLMKATMMANPFALVIAGIAALTAGFIYFYKTNEGFRNKVNEIGQSLSALMAPIGKVIAGLKLLWSGFKAIFTSDWSVSVAGLKNEFTKLFPESLWNGMTKLANGMKAVVEGTKMLTKAFKAIAFNDWSVSVAELHDRFTEMLPESLWNSMTKLANGIKPIIEGFKSGSGSIDIFRITLKVVKSVFIALLGPVGLVVKAFELFAKVIGGGDITKGMDSIFISIQSLAEGIATYGPQLGTSFGTALQGILGAIATALPGIISGGLQVISGFVLGIAQGLPTLALAAAQLINSFTQSMLILIPTIIESSTRIIIAWISGLTTALPQIIEAGIGLINALLQGITQQMPTLIANGANLIITWLNALTQHLPDIVVAGMNLLIALLQGIASKIGDLTNAAISVVVNFAKAVASRMGDIVNVAVNLMVNFVNALASRMNDIVGAAANLIANFINGIANNLGKIIDAAVNLIVKFLDGISRKIPDIVNAAMNLVDALVRGVVQAQGRLMDAAIDLVNGFADNIRNRQDDVRNAAWNLLDAIRGVFVPDSLWNAGVSIINGFLDGLQSGFENVKGFVGGIADWIEDHKGPISYDKKLLIPAGKSIMAGLNRGLNDHFKNVQKNISSMGERLSTNFDLGFDLYNASSINPESALGTGRMGLASVGGQIINNSSESKSYSPNFHFNIERADLSNDQSIEDTSLQLAKLTERQSRGRL
ncbi:tape measure protein [Enterococcus malodoratus]|uniref:tape measure protein n=1 Tax=Enterococcus malodoratus TaxID=71451 RepID=UPI0020732CA6|nr:tape measure protein [Enterococcus malodoratus]